MNNTWYLEKVSRDKVKTGVLFATPSFWVGIAQTFDFFGDFIVYNESRTPEEADAKALYNDWKMIGDDIQSSMTDVAAQFNV